jgi:hypothetical protein
MTGVLLSMPSSCPIKPLLDFLWWGVNNCIAAVVFVAGKWSADVVPVSWAPGRGSIHEEAH